MAAKVSSLTGNLTINVNQWTAGLKQAERNATAFQKSLKPMTQFASTVGKSLVAAGVVVGGALVAMAKKAADYGDEMLEASQKTGIGIRQLSALRLVAEQSGSSFEGITGATAKLSKTMFDAATKGGESAKVFKSLGINIKDAGGNVRQAANVLPEFADRISRMKDGTEKTAIVMKALGKNGAELIPTLNQGSAGFARATSLIDKYNVALTETEAKLGDDFNDALKETGLAMQGLANQIGKALLPAMTRMVEMGNNAIAMLSSWAKEHPGLTRAIAGTSAALVGAGGFLIGISALGNLLPKITTGIDLFTKILVPGGAKAATAAKGVTSLSGSIAGLGSALTRLLPLLTKVGAGLAAVYIGKKISDFTGLTDVVIKLASDLERLGKVVVFFAGNIKDAISGGLVEFAQQLRLILDYAGSLGGPLGAVANAIGRIGEQIKKLPLPDADDFFLHGLGKLTGSLADLAETTIPPPRLGPPGLTGKALEAFEAGNPELRKRPGGIDLGGLSDEADKAAKELERLKESFTESLRPADEYDKLIGKLRANIKGLTDGDILSVYGDQILEAAKAQREHGFEISDNIRLLATQVVRVNELKAAQENLAEVYERMSDIFAREREELRGRMQQQEVTIDRGDLAPKLADMARWGAFRQSVADNADEIERLAGDMAKFADEGYSAAQIEAVFGARMEDVIERAKVLGVTLDKSTVSILRQKSEAQKLADSFEDTFGSISDNLVDMIVDFDFSFRRLKDIGLSTAKSLGRSFLDGFFKPFKDQLEGLGRKVGQWASGLLFGGSAAQAQQGQQQGGLLGGLLGGVGGNLLGKIFGRGSGQGGLLGGIFGGGGVDAAAGNPAMALAGQNPVALGLQIADKAVDLYNKTFGRIGAGRRSANEIVKSEDTFVKQTLAGILADSSLSATNKLKLVTNEFQMFQDNLARFSAAGDKNVITANQSFATVSPLVANIKRDLIAQGAVEGGGDGSGGTVQHITVAPGAIVLQLTDVHTPEEFISWLDKNKAGMAIRIAERVLALEGAIVTR